MWIHGDCLSPTCASLAAHPGAPAVFVFDDTVLDGYRVSLGRIQFMYECLLEIPVVIRRGDVVAEVVAFAREHGAAEVVTVDTPAPRFALLRARITQKIPVVTLRDEPLVAFPPGADLKRFSRYWRRVERQLTHREPQEEQLPGFAD